jgi:ornithine carbamoyltransferase
MTTQHFLSLADFSADWYRELFDLTKDLKEKQHNRETHHLLAGRVLTMIFQKPSARTRLSFDVAMFQLGGYAVNLGKDEIQIGKRESIADISRVVSRMSDGIMARLFAHRDIEELAEYATVPVINGLTDLNHPCQIMADAFTIQEHLGTFENKKIVFIGDGNNVVNSWLNFSMKFPLHLTLAIPSEEYDPNAEILAAAQKAGVSTVEIVRDPMEAVKDADVLYTDVWTSMGQEEEKTARLKSFEEFQINGAMLEQAGSDAIVLHCLPAHRGEEITDEVMESSQSVVFDEAENRLHTEKAILVRLLG